MHSKTNKVTFSQPKNKASKGKIDEKSFYTSVLIICRRAIDISSVSVFRIESVFVSTNPVPL